MLSSTTLPVLGPASAQVLEPDPEAPLCCGLLGEGDKVSRRRTEVRCEQYFLPARSCVQYSPFEVFGRRLQSQRGSCRLNPESMTTQGTFWLGIPTPGQLQPPEEDAGWCISKHRTHQPASSFWAHREPGWDLGSWEKAGTL